MMVSAAAEAVAAVTTQIAKAASTTKPRLVRMIGIAPVQRPPRRPRKQNSGAARRSAKF